MKLQYAMFALILFIVYTTTPLGLMVRVAAAVTPFG